MEKNVSNLIDVKSDSEPVYGDNDKYKGTKTKIYGDKLIFKLKNYRN